MPSRFNQDKRVVGTEVAPEHRRFREYNSPIGRNSDSRVAAVVEEGRSRKIHVSFVVQRATFRLGLQAIYELNRGRILEAERGTYYVVDGTAVVRPEVIERCGSLYYDVALVVDASTVMPSIVV